MTENSKEKQTQSSGKLFAFVSAFFYALFTLLPDSHSLIVSWPWVFIWQVGLIFPVLWLLAQVWQTQYLKPLGNGIDWLMGIIAAGLITSTIFAEFPNQARWYAWVTLCFIAALYALNYWLDSNQRCYQLLKGQGYLSIAFIVISLGLWTTQTFLPELARLELLKQSGINLTYDFSVLELQNWAPFGHQNYVAGYLLLALPLLVGLALLEKSWKRWLWLTGFGLGLLNLYTTSSRGGWLGFLVVVLVGLGFFLVRSHLPLLSKGLASFGIVAIAILIVFSNNRLRSLLLEAFSGNIAGQSAYRIVTSSVGYRMGLDHLLSGVGLGGVPLLYQKYLPVWGGREAELNYQLHSTPFQLWAEMGLWSILIGTSAFILLIFLTWRWLFSSEINRKYSILIASCLAAFLAYGVISLTDYQLDNIAISGTLLIYLASLTFLLPSARKPILLRRYTKFLVLSGLGIILAVTIWLIPIHRAWQLSSQGFDAYNQEKPNLNAFVKSLSQAHRLVPWESYYPYQLGWKLGDLALQSNDPQQQELLITEAINWLEKGIEASPYSEFGRSNLGWLLLGLDPQAAAGSFASSIELVPNKRGVFYGLGLSLLAQGNKQLAVEAFTLEILRNPLFITSPVWNSGNLQLVYPQVVNNVIDTYGKLLEQNSEPSPFKTYLHRSRGAVYWWTGNKEAARKDLKVSGDFNSQLLLKLFESKTGETFESELAQLPPSPQTLVFLAWLKSGQRSSLLQQAWLESTQTSLPPKTEAELMAGMENSTSIEQWLKQNAPVWQYRFQRAGFGVNYRHIDGFQPTDFFPVVENVAITTWFSNLFPTLIYSPELDFALQPQRNELLDNVRNILGKGAEQKMDK